MAQQPLNTLIKLCSEACFIFNELEISVSGPTAWSPSRRTYAQYFTSSKNPVCFEPLTLCIVASTLFRYYQVRLLIKIAAKLSTLDRVNPVQDLFYTQQNSQDVAWIWAWIHLDYMTKFCVNLFKSVLIGFSAIFKQMTAPGNYITLDLTLDSLETTWKGQVPKYG